MSAFQKINFVTVALKKSASKSACLWVFWLLYSTFIWYYMYAENWAIPWRFTQLCADKQLVAQRPTRAVQFWLLRIPRSKAIWCLNFALRQEIRKLRFVISVSIPSKICDFMRHITLRRSFVRFWIFPIEMKIIRFSIGLLNPNLKYSGS